MKGTSAGRPGYHRPTSGQKPGTTHEPCCMDLWSAIWCTSGLRRLGFILICCCCCCSLVSPVAPPALAGWLAGWLLIRGYRYRYERDDPGRATGRKSDGKWPGMELQRNFCEEIFYKLLVHCRQASRQAGRRARSIQRDSSSSCGAGPDAAAAIGRRISCGKRARKQVCSTRFLKRIIKIFAVLQLQT